MDEEPIIEQKESIKLIKNTKGYNWEIKVFPRHFAMSSDENWLDRIQKLNEEMKKRFGVENG
jgi:hypothetical protein